MRVSVFAILLLAVLVILTFVVVLVWRRRPQFSLRTLTIACTVVAVAFSAWYSWQWWSLARLTWIDPASPEARGLLVEPSIVEKDGKFQASFRPRHRGAPGLLDLAWAKVVGANTHPIANSLTTRTLHQAHEITMESDGRVYLEALLTALQKADVPQPGVRVIHGRVADSAGEPVGGATVDLLGPYVYINHFQTRPDGTFTMPLEAPPQSGYWLRIRYAGDTKRMETPSFLLSDDPAVRMVLIRVR
jgi:hypothetical protein